MKRKKSKDTRALIYGPEFEELGGDGSQFVVVEKAAALKAVSGFRARTWGEFAAVANISFSELMDSWGEELDEYFGCRPTENDPFSLVYCWGAWYFSDLIDEPRQAAVDFIHKFPDLREAFNQAGFKVECGAPGAGVDSLIIPSRACIERLPQDIASHLHEDEALLRASLMGEAG